MRKLFLVPARGGSKGLKRKNVLPLAGRPMIYYTLDAAKNAMKNDDELCVSTDDHEIRNIVTAYGLKVPFIRPKDLASDTASTEAVIHDAVNWYRNSGKKFDIIILLQVTSPFRTSKHICEALSLWSAELDMLVSVKESKANPYFSLMEENKNGRLVKSKQSSFTRRQDCPKVYLLNGAIYIIKTDSLLTKKISEFKDIVKYEMDDLSSIDIDSHFDFKIAETLMLEKLEE